MKIGFTGTRAGLTAQQAIRIFRELQKFEVTEVHHGDCVGADEMVHYQLVPLLGKPVVNDDETRVERIDVSCHVVVHPPDNPSRRAFCGHGEQREKVRSSVFEGQAQLTLWEEPEPEACEVNARILGKKPYLARNRDIVNAADVLIAGPGGMEEIMRSGTWATVRYARKKQKPVIIVYPNGEVVRE